MYRYPIAIEVGSETDAWGVIVPDIEGCFSAGDSLNETAENAREAICGHLELIAEAGEVPPEPSSISGARDEVLSDNEPDQQYVWFLVDIDPTPYF